MKLDDSTTITEVIMTNMDDDTESTLYEEKGSKCHFYKKVDFQNFIITLRLDWSDVINGDPILDADIWRKPKNKKNRLKNGRWHHTRKNYDPTSCRYIYSFEFQNLKLRLAPKITVAKDINNDFRCY